MFPKRFQLPLETYLFFAALAGASAVQFDSKRKLFFTTWLTKIHAKLCGLGLIAQFLFSLIRCVGMDRGNTFEFNLCVMVTFAISLPILAYFSQMFQPEGVKELCNVMFKYASDYKRKLNSGGIHVNFARVTILTRGDGNEPDSCILLGNIR